MPHSYWLREGWSSTGELHGGGAAEANANRPQAQPEGKAAAEPIGHHSAASSQSKLESVVFMSEPDAEQKLPPTSEMITAGVAGGLIALVACAAIIGLVFVSVRRRRQLALHYGMLDSDRGAGVNPGPVGPMAV